MIDAIKQGTYEVHTNVINEQVATSNQSDVKKTATKFNIQEVLQEVQQYTYSQENVKGIDKELVEGLSQKFSIQEEDIYKLKEAGFDLEQLYIEDYSSYQFEDKKKNGVKSLSDEEEDKLEEKLETIKNGSDAMYLSSLNSQKDITINSLYESNFKGNYKKSNLVFKDSEVADVLKMNGLDANQQNTWAAKMLLNYGMEVDVQSVKKLNNTQAAIDSLDAFVEKQKEIEALDEKAIEDRLLLKDGEITYDAEDIKALKDELGRVTDKDIKEVLEKGTPVNIKNLKEVMYKNTEQALGINKGALSKGLGENLEQDVEIIKSQINQIRAKLTTEAAQRISEKMPLESMQLSQIVEEINVLEGKKIDEVLQTFELEATPENKEILQNVIDTKALIMQNTQTAVEVEVATAEMITLEQMKYALSSYSGNESAPETRFGESIKKVEDQIEKILENQGIEINKETITAAKALITNKIEVTPEQIDSVLQTTVKISTFLEEMSPMAAAKLIKEGINPYKSSIDQLLTWISDEKIASLKGSVAESIVALEEKGQIDKIQKEAMLGLYRIMQAVEVNREEVIGYIYKNNLPLTVEHLQEATKYTGTKNKQGQVSVKVDDHLGEVVERTEGKTAKSMLEKSSMDIAKSVEVVQSVESMSLALETDTESKLRRINAFLYPFIKQQFKDQMGRFEGMSTLPESFLEKLEYIKTVNPEVVSTMVESNVPLTVSNIYWFDKINENPTLYAEVLQRNQMLKEDLPDKLEEIEAELEEVEMKMRGEKEGAVSSGDINKYKNCKQIEEIIQTQKQLIKQEGIYQIPFMINGEQRLINLQVQKDGRNSEYNKNSLKAVISYETKHLGKIKTYIEIKDGVLNYKVHGENDSITRELSKYSEKLNGLIEAIGYAVNRDEFEASEEKSNEKLLIMSKKGEGIFEEVV